MGYVVGATIGIAVGVIIGQLKNIFIWKGYAEKGDSSDGNENAQAYSRAMISYLINMVVLLLIFLARNMMPWNWMAFIIAVATGMAFMNIGTAVKRKY